LEQCNLGFVACECDRIARNRAAVALQIAHKIKERLMRGP
jgi:hypothetical protein